MIWSRSRTGRCVLFDEWALVIPVDPSFVPDPAAQLRALQLWSTRDKLGASKALELHDAVRYYPPAEGTLQNVCCPNCRQGVEPEWFEDAVSTAKQSHYTNLLAVIPCCGAFVSLNDLKPRSGFLPYGFARFSMRGYQPDPLSLGQITLRQLEGILGCALKVIWLRIQRQGGT